MLAKQRQGLRRDIAIEPCQDAIGVLEHRHLRPQPPPHAAEFQADVAAADHDEMPRHRVEGERLGARADEPAIDLDAGQDDALAADREDDAGRVERRARAVARGHLDPPRAGETARATHPGHLVLGEQGLDALGERRDDVVFPLHHGGEIERHAADMDAVLGELVARLFILVARFEQGLRGNAAHAQAGAAELLLLLDDGRLHAKLRRPDRSHVATRAATDHHEIELHERLIPPRADGWDPRSSP